MVSMIYAYMVVRFDISDIPSSSYHLLVLLVFNTQDTWSCGVHAIRVHGRSSYDSLIIPFANAACVSMLLALILDLGMKFKGVFAC
jgi:hypothetical protein